MDIGQQWRRRMTGFWMMANPMFGYRFRHLQKLHSDAFMGLNAVCLPETNPPGAVYRSSLPATPVSTPIWENHHYFSEQALRDRLCKTPSPRKCRLFLPRGSIPEVGLNELTGAPSCSVVVSRSPNDSGEQTPSSTESLSRESTPDNGEQHEIPKEEEEQTIPDEKMKNLKRKLFVGNISYRISKRELKSFFSTFGRVSESIVVHDHIKRKPKGYGFVTFEKLEDAERVSKISEPLLLDGRELRILPAEEKRTTKLRKATKHLLTKSDVLSVSPTLNEHPVVSLVPKAANNINELTDDVLLIIFAYLNAKDRSRIESVCKRWQILALKTWQSQVVLQHWSCFSCFKGCALNNNALTSILKKSAPNLRKLDLSTAPHCLDFRAMEIIAHLCPNLESINLTGMQVTNISLQQLAQKCPKLKAVILRSCFDVGEKGFWWLLHLCKDLELLDVSGSRRLTGQCFHMARQNLHTVILNSCIQICPMGFTKLATKCQNLTSLYLNKCVKLTDRALELLCQSLKKLTVLHVGGHFEDLSSTGMHHIGRLSSLEELSVAHNSEVDDHAVCAISRGCRRLRILILSGCHNGVTDSSLRSISECPRIRTLHISYLDKVTDDGVSAVARQGQLEVLQAKGCPNLGDKGFVAVALMCPSIQLLDVSGCFNVTNLTLQACMERVNCRPPGLRLEITIGGTNITPENFKLDNPDLEVCSLNLCLNHLRPDRAEYFGLLQDEVIGEEDIEDEAANAEENGQEEDDHAGNDQGAQGGNDYQEVDEAKAGSDWPMGDDFVEDFLTADDPAMAAEMWPS